MGKKSRNKDNYWENPEELVDDEGKTKDSPTPPQDQVVNKDENNVDVLQISGKKKKEQEFYR